MLEQSPSDITNKVVSFDKIDEDKKSGKTFEEVSLVLNALNVLTDFLGGISDELIVTGSSVDFPLSACVHINSAGIGAAAKLAVQSLIIPKFVKEMRYALDVEEEEIWYEKE